MRSRPWQSLPVVVLLLATTRTGDGKRSTRPADLTNPNFLRVLLIPLLALGGIGACGSENPVKPANHDPVMQSAAAFPAEIGPSDSVIVVCLASDSDADPLVYDWLTDGRLTIAGEPTSRHSLYNTVENYHMFYPATVAVPVDTPWVQCVVRDGRGGADARLVRFIVRQ